MDSMGTIASSGLTITLTPAQAIVGASILGVVLLSNAKSLLFMWHVKYPSPFRHAQQLTISRDDCSHNLHGISYYDALNSQ